MGHLRVGDFNGDRTSDILLRNGQTDELAIWGIANTQIASGTILSSSASDDWTIEPTGKLNSDSINDLLLTNAASGEVATWLVATAPMLSASDFLLV